MSRESIPQALYQYDVTFRVFSNMNALLYPVLASAIDDPVIRSPVSGLRSPEGTRNYTSWHTALERKFHTIHSSGRP